jgi:prepilin-type processing-associated H-X9-DG protein
VDDVVSYAPNIYIYQERAGHTLPPRTNGVSRDKVNHVINPSEKVFIGDSNTQFYLSPSQCRPGHVSEIGFRRHGGSQRSNSGANMLFFDGHARFVAYGDMTYPGTVWHVRSMFWPWGPGGS